MSDERTIQVDRYTTWQGKGRVTLRNPDGRTHALTLEQATALLDDLTSALKETQEVDDMFEEECRAATHGPRNSTCTCEDSRDE